MNLPSQILEAMVAHARFCAPEEACGLLAFDHRGELRFAYCLTNVEASPTRYTVDPVEHFRALQHAEANGWELAGAFHSHPVGSALPSVTDIERALEPDWTHIIVGLGEPHPPDVRAFRIDQGRVEEKPLTVE